jgi:hypothetical protein
VRKNFVSLFKVSGTDNISVAMIEFAGAPTSTIYNEYEGDSDDYLRTETMRSELWRVRFYYAWDDSAASEKTVANLAEDIIEAIDSYNALHTTPQTTPYIYAQPAVCPVFEPRIWARKLVHYAEIQVTVEEQIHNAS